ncbi:hypothetical protein CN918_27635 [Priestia megaterium]|nr:hypothetical protein CN918_27635 [Priestia megaterium]
MERFYQELDGAVEENNWEVVDAMLKARGEELAIGAYSKEEIAYMLENDKKIYPRLKEKQDEIKKLSLEQRSMKKAVSRYQDE